MKKLSLFLLLIFGVWLAISRAEEYYGDDCEIFLLDDTECWSFLADTLVVVPENVTQLEIFEEFAALPISDVRMDSKNCRHPFIQFVCLQTFPPCSGPPEIEYCSYCTLAERFCQSSLPFNCSNYCTLTTDDEDNGSYNGSYNGPETVPVLTCVNETSSNITCCPNPFFLSSKTEECEYPRCPFYAYGKDQQEALMYVYYIFSWISLISSLFAMRPFCCLHNFEYPHLLFFTFITSHLLFLFTTNWGVYVGGYDFVCEVDQENLNAYGEERGDFFESRYCLAQTFLFSFFLLLTCCCFVWFAFKYLWEGGLKAYVPVDIHLQDWYKTLLIVFIISSLSVSLFLSVLYFGLILNDPADQISLSFNFMCIPRPNLMGYIILVPALTLVTIASVFLVLHVFFLWSLGNSIATRSVLSMILFIIALDGTLGFFFSIRGNITHARRELNAFAECVATHPQEADYVEDICSYKLDGFEWIFIVLFLLASYPAFFFLITVFSQKEYWRWWMEDNPKPLLVDTFGVKPPQHEEQVPIMAKDSL